MPLRQHAEPGPGFILVLGAGGRVGMASHAGVICALAEVGGVDPASAELVIGTSAGSVVGALLRLGWSPREIWGIVTRTADLPAADDLGRADLFRRAWRTPSQLVRRSMGSAYVLTRSVVRVPLLPVPPVARRLFPGGFLSLDEEEADLGTGLADEWPAQPLWLCTVDVETGRRLVLGRRDDRPPLSRAVLASCAIPGFYQPIRFGRRTLVDGGIHSTTNLDLAALAGPQVVIASAPMGFDPARPPGAVGRSVRTSVNRGIDRGCEEVRASGRTLLELRPGPEEVAAQRLNAMRDHDLEPVAVAAYDAAARRLSRPHVQEQLAALRHLAPAPALAG